MKYLKLFGGLTLITIILCILKLTNIINCKWIYVFIPMIIEWVIILVGTLIGIIIDKSIRIMIDKARENVKYSKSSINKA